VGQAFYSKDRVFTQQTIKKAVRVPDPVVGSPGDVIIPNGVARNDPLSVWIMNEDRIIGRGFK
jgi:hypothetical protein